jgi:hypothetical protein
METYTFFIEDDRYPVPTLEFVLVRDEARARQMASERLIASAHHLGIEVHRGGSLAFRVERPKSRGDDDTIQRQEGQTLGRDRPNNGSAASP